MNNSAYEEIETEKDNSLEQITKLNESVLWQGKVIIKRNESKVYAKFAIIHDDRIVIRNKDEFNSPETTVISRDDIITIDFPHIDESIPLLTGYRGFVISYKSDEKIKEISMWAKGLGQHPNPDKMKSLSKALETLYMAINSDEEPKFFDEHSKIQPVQLTPELMSIVVKPQDEPKIVDVIQEPENTSVIKHEKPAPVVEVTNSSKASRSAFTPYLTVAMVSFTIGFILAAAIAVTVVILGFI